MLEVAPLPQLGAEGSFSVVRRALFEHSGELAKGGFICRGLHEQVEMVGHETVRNYCKGRSTRRLKKLRQDQINRVAIHEDSLPAVRADRQGISIEAGVRKVGKSRDRLVWHAAGAACERPT